MLNLWQSAWCAGYDKIVGMAAPSPSDAVEVMLQLGDQLGNRVPQFYMSTAITTGGWRRDQALDLRDVIARNNRTSALIMEQMTVSAGSLLTQQNVMVPTELGPVKGWDDLHYLQFYFGWLGGLSLEGMHWFAEQLADSVYDQVFAPARDPHRTREERWPSYRVFTEIAIAKLQQARSVSGRYSSEGSSVMVQMVDTGISLGCRAEALFAESQGLDLLAPALGPSLPEDLGADVGKLRTIGARIGVVPTGADPVAVRLSR